MEKAIETGKIFTKVGPMKDDLWQYLKQVAGELWGVSGVSRRVRVGLWMLMGAMAGVGVKRGRDVEEVGWWFAVGLAHDVGKLAVAVGVLDKPGKLSEEEFEVIKRHVTSKAWPVFLVRIQSWRYPKRWKRVYEALAWHHMNWDGSGYGPDGEVRKGMEIPEVARMIHAADWLDALRNRNDRKADGRKMMEVEREILRGVGSLFDPEIGQVARDWVRMFGENAGVSGR